MNSWVVQLTPLRYLHKNELLIYGYVKKYLIYNILITTYVI